MVAALTLTPYGLAELSAPRGQAFVGAFYYVDDFYNYLSYAQQAEEGAAVFQNRVLLGEHQPALVNLEWWLVGRTSALMGGGRLLAAYRLFAVAAALGFVLVVDLWLRRLGLADGPRLPALLLVATGGGLGGLLFSLTGRPIPNCLDLYAGLFPFLGLSVNPHFVAGTILLLLALHLFDTSTTARGQAGAVAVATALALVRPYDLVILVVVRTGSVLLLEPRRRWIPALAPLLGLLPVVLYLYWLFYRHPAFAFYAETRYVFPPLSDFLWALGPATLLALAGVVRREADPAARRARVHLAVWAGVALLVILARPVHFSLQFLVGMGLPLLALGAFGLARAPRPVLPAVALAFAASQIVLVRFLSEPRPMWLVPRPEMELARALRPACRPGDVLFAPPTLGLLTYGLTPCRAFLSHRVDPGYEQRFAELQAFSSQQQAEERSALLDRYRITHLVLPGRPGPVPSDWLGAGTPFRRSEIEAGAPLWTLYVRPRP